MTLQEWAAPGLPVRPEGKFTEADAEWVKKTQNVAGLLIMLIGPRGGGKTTVSSWFVQDFKESEPKMPRVSNVPIENAVYVPDILKFLATKLIVEGSEKPYEIKDDGTVHIHKRTKNPIPMLVVIDEGAISGLEARGSGLYSLNSYLLALSRKINVVLILVSQLMSMIEKRGQWLADFYWLCEPMRDRYTQDIAYFNYRVFDESFKHTRTWKLPFEWAKDILFEPPTFDTNDVPNYNELAEAFKKLFNISEDDIAFYHDVVRGTKHESLSNAVVEPEEKFIVMRKSLLAPRGRLEGETLILEGRRYRVLQRDFDVDAGEYRYRVIEVADPALKVEPPKATESLSKEPYIDLEWFGRKWVHFWNGIAIEYSPRRDQLMGALDSLMDLQSEEKQK